MSELQVDDIGSPEYLAYLAWLSVFKAWSEGDPEPMATWVLNPDTVIVEDARAFLADVLRGKAKRRPGLKSLRSGEEVRRIVAEVYQAREDLPDDVMKRQQRAIEVVAKRHRLSEGTIEGILSRAARTGFTFENWQRYGRPSW